MSATVHDLAAHSGFVPDERPGLSDAQEVMLREPDTLADWICGECNGVARVGWFQVMKDRTAEDFSGHSIGYLLALAFDRGQPAGTRTAAIDAIGDRFLADPVIADCAAQLAVQIEERRIESERQDFEERVEQFARITGHSVTALTRRS